MSKLNGLTIQQLLWPSLQVTHSSQLSLKGPAATLSPFLWSLTSEPTEIISPIISWPGQHG